MKKGLSILFLIVMVGILAACQPHSSVNVVQATDTDNTSFDSLDRSRMAKDRLIDEGRFEYYGTVEMPYIKRHDGKDIIIGYSTKYLVYNTITECVYFYEDYRGGSMSPYYSSDGTVLGCKDKKKPISDESEQPVNDKNA